jgi:hypothetical protein
MAWVLAHTPAIPCFFSSSKMQKRLYLGSIVILVVGLCSAILIYLTADEGANADDASEIVVVDGIAYPIPLRDSKMYRRELQRFGGKAAVLFDDLDHWFVGLWRGKALAVTVAWISAFLSLGVFLLERELPSDSKSDTRGEDNRDEPG